MLQQQNNKATEQMEDDSGVSGREKRLQQFNASQKQPQRKFHPVRREEARDESVHDDDDDDDDDDDPGVYSIDGDPVTERRSFNSFIGFTAPRPLAFTKHSTNSQAEPEREQPKLSSIDVQKLSNTMRTGKNNFKSGKRYGIGATIMRKWGYVEGQGLGKDGTGILEPIEQKGTKFGQGIGSDETLDYEDDVSSDEEYYRDVPKKSLYQIILELEEKGVAIPDHIKRISDENTKDASKPFIKLQRSGNVDVEAIRTKLDNYNKELDDVLAEQRVQEHERAELESKLTAIDQLSKLHNKLLEIFHEWELYAKLESYQDLRSSFKQFPLEKFSKIPGLDLQKYIILTITPRITHLLDAWDPLDLENTAVIDELISWNESLPVFPDLYGELNYFQSLVCSKWYPKITNVFNSNWTIDQPNIAITILLDWMEVIDSKVIDVFIFNVIGPKIINTIRDWNPDVKVENPPYLWIFEWKPYLKEKYDEVVLEFTAKYKSWFENWDGKNDRIEGLHSFIEIAGDESFSQLVDKSLLPNICSLLIKLDIDFTKDSIRSLNTVFQWEEFLDAGKFQRLLNIGFGNAWLRSLYNSLSQGKHFSKIARSLQSWFKVLNSHKSTVFYVKGLDMINQFIDTGNLTPIHISHSKIKLLELILNESQESTKAHGIPQHRLQITFKDVVERYCDQHNLFLTPQKGDLSSKHLLFKLSRDPQGKSGKTCYIDEDVLFIKQGNTFEPISIDSLNVVV